MGKNALPRAHVSTAAPINADHRPRNVEALEASAANNKNDLNNEQHENEDTLQPTIPISRKEKRRLKKNPHAIDLPSPPTSDSEPTPKRKPPPNNPSRIPPSMRPTAVLRAANSYPLLVCSIGNPGSVYANTFHSAGHTITSHITSVKSYKPFSKGLSGLIARPDNTTYRFHPLHGYSKTDGGQEEGGDDWTFWQSTALMNNSGKSLAKAWREFSAQAIKDGKGQARLVVIHDELESALGKVSLKDGSWSAKGHNGIKSVQASLGGTKWWRIGVGIGRPASREPDAVAGYVLTKMGPRQRAAMEESCASVVELLREISEEKR